MSFLDIFPLVLLFLVVIAILVISFLRLSGRRRAWSAAASQANLTFEPGNLWGRGMKVQGVYRGHELVLDTFSVYYGDSRKIYTRVILPTSNPAGLQLEIFEEGLLGKLGKALGMKDVQVGNDAIDQRFIIRGQPEDRVASLFTSINLQQRLLEARRLHFKLAGSQLSCQRPGAVRDESILMSIFDLIVDLADQIERLY